MINNDSNDANKFNLKLALEAAKNNLNDTYIYLMSAIIFIQLILIIFPVSIKVTLIIFLFSLLIFSVLSPLLKDKTKELSFVGFKISIILLVYNSFMTLGKMLDGPELTLASKKPLMFFISTFVSIAISTYYINKENRSKIDENLLSLQGLKFILGEKKEVAQEGDVVLCINQETEEPVILPFEDRFLHMLVLGPTGSGKTSQIIIPMINQDMQNKNYGMTVIEPKGDLAERVYAMAVHYGREAVYFNPSHPDCPYFNPLYGDESEVIENMATTFKMLSASEKSNPFFDNMNENLIRNALKLLKRLKGNTATLIDLSTIVYNSQGQGKVMVNQFARVKTKTIEESKENGDIASWFLSDYYNERSKTYEHCSGLRSQVSKIISNEHLRRVLNPPNGENDVDFGAFIEEGKILAISTAQGELRDLGRFLGYFIILNFQSAVFKRPGDENTRRPHFLYIDEFQTYSNPGFADMLTQGRSYKVASHLATQNRALMAMGGGSDGNSFVELVSTNARNIVLFPGGNSKDTKYYSDEFGEELKFKKKLSTNRTKFSMLHSMKKTGPPSQSISESEEMGTRFSSSDLIYKEFGEIAYRIVKNKTVQTPGLGKVSWISKDLNDHLTGMIGDYKEGVDITAPSYLMREQDIKDKQDIEEVDINSEPMDVVISFDDDNDDIEMNVNIDPLAGEDSIKDLITKPIKSDEVTIDIDDDDDDDDLDVISFDVDTDYDDESDESDKSDEDKEDNDKSNDKNEAVNNEDSVKDPLNYEEYDDLI